MDLNIRSLFGGNNEELSEDEINAEVLLKADHRKVEALFKEYEEGSKQRQSIKEQVIKELTIHAQVEEEIIYPALDKINHEGAGEAKEEHHVVKVLLVELESMPAGSDETKAKMKVLGEIVKHHVKEEEHELFPEMNRSDVDMDALGQKLKARKEELLRQYKPRKQPAKKTTANKGKVVPARKAAATKKTASAAKTNKPKTRSRKVVARKRAS
ncbi:MAG: hemerythrin domain-containing protein [Candidatus Obscuribacterales bacterium]|nr:hemerythrin domain-containing protein [Candidatus Obscuribacterales bacterium]